MKPKFEIGQTVYYIFHTEIPQVLSYVVDGYWLKVSVNDEVVDGYSVKGAYEPDVDNCYADRNEAGRELIKLLEERLVKVESSIAPLKEVIAAARVLYNVEDDQAGKS